MFSWGGMMAVAAFFGALGAGACCIAAASLLDALGSSGEALAWLSALGVTHVATTAVAWSALESALEKGASRGRAMIAAVGAATVWLAGVLLALAAWYWVLATYF